MAQEDDFRKFPFIFELELDSYCYFRMLIVSPDGELETFIMIRCENN